MTDKRLIHIFAVIRLDGRDHSFEWYAEGTPSEQMLRTACEPGELVTCEFDVVDVSPFGLATEPLARFVRSQLAPPEVTGATADPVVGRVNELDRGLRNLEREVSDGFKSIAEMLGRLSSSAIAAPLTRTVAVEVAREQSYPAEGMVPPGTKPSVRDRRRVKGEDADMAENEMRPNEKLDSDSMSIVGPIPYSQIFQPGENRDGKVDMIPQPMTTVGNTMRIGTRSRTPGG